MDETQMTPAHYAALERRFEWQSLVEQESGEADLWRWGMWERVKVPHVKRNGKKGWEWQVRVTEAGRAALANRRTGADQ